jgi:hypothetical protein
MEVLKISVKAACVSVEDFNMADAVKRTKVIGSYRK